EVAVDRPAGDAGLQRDVAHGHPPDAPAAHALLGRAQDPLRRGFDRLGGEGRVQLNRNYTVVQATGPRRRRTRWRTAGGPGGSRGGPARGRGWGRPAPAGSPTREPSWRASTSRLAPRSPSSVGSTWPTRARWRRPWTRWSRPRVASTWSSTRRASPAAARCT